MPRQKAKKLWNKKVADPKTHREYVNKVLCLAVEPTLEYVESEKKSTVRRKEKPASSGALPVQRMPTKSAPIKALSELKISLNNLIETQNLFYYIQPNLQANPKRARSNDSIASKNLKPVKKTKVESVDDNSEEEQSHVDQEEEEEEEEGSAEEEDKEEEEELTPPQKGGPWR